MRNKNRLSLTVILCITILASASGLLYGKDKLEQEREALQQAVSSISEQVNKLRVLIDLSGGGQYSSRVVLQGSIPVRDNEWEQSRLRWYAAADIPTPLQPKEERGRQVYRAMYKLNAAEIQVLFFDEASGRSYYVVTVSGQGEGGMKQTIEEVTRLYQRLVEAEYEPEWNATLQSKVQGDRIQAWNRVESAVTELGLADALDYYEDNRTISVSYMTSYMDNTVDMQGEAVNLQAAVHEDVEHGTTQITFGNPLINGEY